MNREKNREIQALEISTAARVAREEGRMEEKKETALSLLKMGLSLDKISTVTGLTPSAIEKLAAMNNK